MKKKTIGVDTGSRRVKAVSFVNGKFERVSFPSLTVPGSLDEYILQQEARDGKKKPISERLKSNEYAIHIQNGVEHFVGELAVRQAPQDASSGFGVPGRYWSDRSIELILTSSVLLAPDDEELELYICTGLPAQTYRTRGAIDKVKKNLIRDFEFTFNGQKYFRAITQVDVLQEGAGATIITAREGLNTQGTIDIGSRTVDLYVVGPDNVIARWCVGTDKVGVEKIVDQVQDWVQREYQTDMVLSPYQRDAILMALAYDNRSFPKITVNGEAIPINKIRQWARQAQTLVGNDINEFIVKSWKDSDSGLAATTFDEVNVDGGGPYFFQETLHTILPHFIVPKQPEWKNAEGYATQAYMLLEDVRSEMAM
jgi:hypothetical protein